MNPDGSGLTNLTNDAAEDWSPAWSPDGTRIAFVRENTDAIPRVLDIYLMNADGSGQTQLFRQSNPVFPPLKDEPLAWSPNGSHILFRAWQGRVYAIQVSGGSGAVLVLGGSNDLQPLPLHRRDSWSADGSRFVAERRTTDYSRIPARPAVTQVMLVGVDGSGITIVQ